MSNPARPAPEAAGDWETFSAFTPTHYVTVAVVGVLVLGLVWLARRVRGTRYENVLRFWLVWLLVAVQAVSLVYYVWPWDPKVSLPLHVCDLAGIVAVFAVAGKNRVLRATLYYWGIALSTQAFATPVLGWGPGYFRFYLFWITHAAIIGAAVYEVTARGFRPTWRDYRAVTLVTLGYAAVVIPLDIWLRANYGYAGSELEPDTTTLLNYLGPWPLRLVWMFLLAQAVFAVLTVAWGRPGRAGQSERSDRADGNR